MWSKSYVKVLHVFVAEYRAMGSDEGLIRNQLYGFRKTWETHGSHLGDLGSQGVPKVI